MVLWDEPAGIWQPVKLSITDPTKVEDVFIKPTLNGATFDVTLKIMIINRKNSIFILILLTKKTGAVLYSGLSIRKLRLNTGEERIETYTINNLKPRLWTPQHPNLYDFKFRLITGKGTELDCLDRDFRIPYVRRSKRRTFLPERQ